jgi:hypothetical protein
MATPGIVRCTCKLPQPLLEYCSNEEWELWRKQCEEIRSACELSNQLHRDQANLGAPDGMQTSLFQVK